MNGREGDGITKGKLNSSEKLCVRRQWAECTVDLGKYAEVAVTAGNRTSVAHSADRTPIDQSSS